MQDAPSQKDVAWTVGDAPDPRGLDPHARGVETKFDLTRTAAGHPIVLCKMPDGMEVGLELDVYIVQGAAGRVDLICPYCLAQGRQVLLPIDGETKRFVYDRDREPPTFPGWSRRDMAAWIAKAMRCDVKQLPAGWGGTISVPRFSCVDSGGRSCGFDVVIDNNVVRRA